MIIWKWSGPRTGLCLPRVQSHLTVGDPVASGILRLSKSNTLISRNMILACNWKESRKIKDDEICLRGPNSVVDFFFEWCLSVCSVSVLEKFLVESRKRLEIALILHYFALWLVQKTHTTNQSDAKLKPITTWSPAFSRALVTLVVFNLNSRCLFKVFFLFSDWLSWLLNLCFITLSRKSLY